MEAVSKWSEKRLRTKIWWGNNEQSLCSTYYSYRSTIWSRNSGLCLCSTYYSCSSIIWSGNRELSLCSTYYGCSSIIWSGNSGLCLCSTYYCYRSPIGWRNSGLCLCSTYYSYRSTIWSRNSGLSLCSTYCSSLRQLRPISHLEGARFHSGHPSPGSCVFHTRWIFLGFLAFASRHFAWWMLVRCHCARRHSSVTSCGRCSRMVMTSKWGGVVTLILMFFPINFSYEVKYTWDCGVLVCNTV
jgi:hypothetical protein